MDKTRRPPTRRGRAHRPRRHQFLRLSLFALATAMFGSTLFVAYEPTASAAPSQDDRPSADPPEGYWFPNVVAVEDLVPESTDRAKLDQRGRTTILVYKVLPNGQRELIGEYQSGGGPHAEFWMNSDIDPLIQEMKRIGAGLALVGDHAPCYSTRHQCHLILLSVARRAAAANVPLQIAFTRSYGPPGGRAPDDEQTSTTEQIPNDEQTRITGATVEMQRLGVDVVVAAPGGDPAQLPTWTRRLAYALDLTMGTALMTPHGTVDRTYAAEVLGQIANCADGQGWAAQPCPPADENGGIDFSSVDLRYMADPGTGDQVSYAFVADPSAEAAEGDTALGAAMQQSDAFFVWLNLDPSTFWVNLNPNEPDRIVDADLGSTEPGRVMLEADLELKRTTAALIHPDSANGAEVWNQLQAGADGSVCVSFRQWIVPGPAQVHEADGGIYILDAPLTVQLESQYLGEQGGGGGTGSPLDSCPVPDPAMEDHNEQVVRDLVLPGVEQAVNEAPEYADLRRVYLARVAAEWYRQQSGERTTAYGDMIDSGNVAPWVSFDNWSPQVTFDAYVDSYTNGEFDVTHETTEGGWVTSETYFYGGVVLEDVPFDSVSSSEFESEYPDLASTVEDALDGTAEGEDGQLWLGSTVTPAPAPGTEPPTPWVPDDPLLDPQTAALLLAIVLPAIGIVLIRKGMRPRQAPHIY